MNNVRIMFLRDAKGQPVGCLAINVSDLDRRVCYQLSVLNPSDNFKREVARVLALGRLVEKPNWLPTAVTKPLFFANGKVSMHDVSTVVMTHLSKSKAPSRAVKAARNWLATNSGSSEG